MALLQNLHGVDEDGKSPAFTVHARLSCSEQFGPETLRALCVRSAFHKFVTSCSESLQFACDGTNAMLTLYVRLFAQ